MRPVRPDRLRDVVDAVLEALDEGLDGAALAARAMPFAVPPSRFAAEARDFRLAAPNAIHFHPPGGLLLPGLPRTTTMDLSDRLVEHDQWLTARLLERAAPLPDEALDRAVRPGLVVVSFEGPEPDVRTMLERLVFAKEVWTAAIGGRAFPAPGERSIAALQARQAAVQPQFTALVRRIRDRGEWDDVFVDALCTPPVSFTLGSVIASILTYAAIRRQIVIDVLRELGVPDVESSEPIDWERALATRT